MPTTATVHTRVFFSTMAKTGLLVTLRKFSNPAKPLIRPALLTSLKAIRNTKIIGTRMKIAMRRTLGRIHTYGSTFLNFFFTGDTSLFVCFVTACTVTVTMFQKNGPDQSVRPIIILVMGMLQSWISQRSLTEGRPVIPEHHRQEVRSALH